MATPILGLSEINESQARKYLTHNEALHQLEGVTIRVLSRSTSGQPDSPQEGDSYIIPADAAGAVWSGYDTGDVAHFYGGAWHRYTPVAGLALRVVDAGEDAVFDGSDWAVKAASLSDGQIGTRKLADFNADPATTTGLTWGYRGGRVRDDNAVTDVAAGTLTLAASAANYVEVDTTGGAVTVNQSGFSAGRIPLRKLTTDAAGITDSQDNRAWIAAGGGGAAAVGDFAQDSAATTGLTFAYRAGRLRTGAVVTAVAAGTLTLTASAANYVDVDTTGAVTVNQSGFSAGTLPLFEVATDATSITTVTDRRAAFALGAGAGGGDFLADGSVPMTGDLDLAGHSLERYSERVQTLQTSGSVSLDLSRARVFAVTLTGDAAIDFTNVPGAGAVSATVELIQDSSAGHSASWAASVGWGAAGPPAITQTAAAVDVVTLYTRDGGTNWRAFLAGQSF